MKGDVGIKSESTNTQNAVYRKKDEESNKKKVEIQKKRDVGVLNPYVDNAECGYTIMLSKQRCVEVILFEGGEKQKSCNET